MKIREMIDVLKREFPDRYVSFEFVVTTYKGGNPKVEIKLWDDKASDFIYGVSFSDCLEKLKARSKSQPVIDIDMEVGV